ncbi:PepSY-associated TM helix domain-containing protein [Luteolibacter sp. SL250]|uniref:PepSY-associated TM helix domain-containing protein n=1 Tax=Luteolibacter sp. SL250 TaxID=2995170 RepID=UPI00226F23F5|nr:PepSY-associated TM helix domain-containing protein [Luteolibacter sp. SL250]WAC20657.1 PepSY-associated TM helix domain-containing protein [Luteolibacter sp. SL250]
MRFFKKSVFWLHLATGLAAGLVILILGLTGVIMSFERQILEANHGVKVSKAAEQVVAGPEKILGNHADASPAASGVTYYSDPEMPASVQFGRGKSAYADPYTGESLGEGNAGLKAFFAWVLRLHRWLTLQGESREIGGNITKAANLVFLFLVISGLYLWFPKRLSRTAFRAVATLQFRLKGRARDWNWHNTFGFWACIPLFFIVITGLVMSYSWANNLIYTAVGETPPPPRGAGGPPAAGGPSREGGERRGTRGGEGSMAREGRAEGGQGERRGRGEGSGPPREGRGGEGGMAARGEGRGGGGHSHDHGHDHDHDHAPVSLTGLDAGFEKVKAASPGWRTIIVSLPKGPTADYSVSYSHRGRPDLRRSLTVDLTSGEIVKNEGFEKQTTGRKLRSFVRWVHTGEALGWFGQALMGVASLAAVILVWTGFALSWRRFFKKRRASVQKQAVLRKAA